MTTNGLQRHWLKTAQLITFVSAIAALAVINFSYSSVEIGRSVILLSASIFALINFKKIKELFVIQKVILLYIIEMFFNQLTGRVFHIRSFSISLSLAAMVPLAVSCICCKFQKSNISSMETNDFLKSWAIVFAVLVLHVLFLFLLLKNVYGYGYESDFSVLANMCLYFLVFAFTWEQLGQINFRRIAAIIFTALFIVIIVKGL